MKLKTFTHEGAEYAVLDAGKPVYVAEDGKEHAFDGAHLYGRVRELTKESEGHRVARGEAETKLQAFDGLDAAAARKALEDFSKIDQKKLIDAGEVDRVKAEISKGYEAKLAEAEKRNQTLEQSLYAEKIGGAFARSPLIVGDKAKLAIPADLVQSHFGRHFKIEDGEVVAYYDPTGSERIRSKADPSKFASFEEALEIIVEAYPHKDAIVRGTGAEGSRAQGGGGGGGAKTMKQADFNALSAKDRAAKMNEGYTLTP